MTERALRPAGLLAGLRSRRAVPRGTYDGSFFRRRTLAVVAMALVFVALGALSGTYVGFDFMQAILDVPGGFAWMATQFVPSFASLQKLGTILPALGSTILASIASSCTAAVLAYICAVLGSRTVGVGGPFPLLVRAVASLFRTTSSSYLPYTGEWLIKPLRSSSVTGPIRELQDRQGAGAVQPHQPV